MDRWSVEAWERHLGHPVDPKVLRAELTAGTLSDAFEAGADRHPDKSALVVDDEGATHAELMQRVRNVAGWLHDLGVRRGDRVLLAGPSSLLLVTAYLGILRAGAAMVPSAPSATEGELRHLLEDAEPVLALGEGEVLSRLQRAGRDLPALRGVLPLSEMDLDARTGALPPITSADLAMLAYTSGTTGHPKGAPLTHANLLASIRGVMMAWRWSEDDLLVHALPLSHQHGLGGIHATLIAGSNAVLRSRFEPHDLAGTIREHQATVLMAVPTVYERLLAAGVSSEAFASLRLAISGSAPLSPQLAERAARLIGQMPLERYGTTESGLDLSNLYDGPRKPGAVGIPFPGVEAMMVDAEGRRVPDGTDGEIVVRGPHVFAGYWRRPEANAAAFLDGEWFRPGDVGRIDPADGFASITGRIKELIVTGGLNVYPREVEIALEASDGVERAAVVGVPSQEWGEAVTAFVVPVAGAMLHPDVLQADLRERLSPYKRPKAIHVVEALPLNAMGKLDRSSLAREAAERSEGRRNT